MTTGMNMTAQSGMQRVAASKRRRLVTAHAPPVMWPRWSHARLPTETPVTKKKPTRYERMTCTSPP